MAVVDDRQTTTNRDAATDGSDRRHSSCCCAKPGPHRRKGVGSHQPGVRQDAHRCVRRRTYRLCLSRARLIQMDCESWLTNSAASQHLNFRYFSESRCLPVCLPRTGEELPSPPPPRSASFRPATGDNRPNCRFFLAGGRAFRQFLGTCSRANTPSSLADTRHMESSRHSRAADVGYQAERFPRAVSSCLHFSCG